MGDLSTAEKYFDKSASLSEEDELHKYINK